MHTGLPGVPRVGAGTWHRVLVLRCGSFLGTLGYGGILKLAQPTTTWQHWDTGRCAKLHTHATKGQHLGTAQVQTCACTGRDVVMVHRKHVNRCTCTTRSLYWYMTYMIKDPRAIALWYWIMAHT